MHWDTAWLVVRDIALTGTGIYVILSQVYAARPSDLLLTAGVVLVSPSIADHAKALLSGPGGRESSAPPPSRPAPPSQPVSPGGTGEQPG